MEAVEYQKVFLYRCFVQAKEVEFKKPPTPEFYGTEAIFVDNSVNWFILNQH